MTEGLKRSNICGVGSVKGVLKGVVKMMYKGIECEEILKSGNEELIGGMYNSVMSRKSKNRGDKKVVEECVKVLKSIEDWKVKNGISVGGKRGIYDEVKELGSLSDEELGCMYESLYSRRSYYKKVGKMDKVKELENRIEEIKEEKKVRNKKKILG